jgi:dipeptidyl aminopeptidase/acylaminoacyl peptidase
LRLPLCHANDVEGQGFLTFRPVPDGGGFGEDGAATVEEVGMLGRREWRAAAVSALLAGGAVVVPAGLDDAKVVEVRVQGGVPTLPESTRIGDASTTTTTAAAASSGRVVWAEKGDVWLYEAETGERRRLTTDGVERHDFKPRFRARGRVTYLTSSEEFGPDPTLVEINLVNGKRHALQRLPGHIRAYDWSPDGKALAYYRAPSDDGVTELHITGNGPDRLRRFVPVLGRGGFIDYDETRLEWSPDGRRLLVQDTALDTSQDETLYILNADGTNAAAPRLGTWARWSADGRTVYCLCTTTPVQADCRWQAIDVTRDVGKPLAIAAGARPALSPDGRLLALDDSADTPSVHVLDLHAPGSGLRFVARGAIAPVWLTPSGLAFTNTRPCPHSEDDCLAGGHGSMFESAGTASLVDLSTGRRSSLPPIATDGADSERSTQ